MSADSIDHPLRVRENSDESLQSESPTGETLSQRDSGASGPSESPNNVNEGLRKDDQRKIPQEENDKTGTLNEHETGSENGQAKSPFNNDRSQKQSEKNHENDGQGGEQQEMEKHGTSPPKDKQTEQVQRSSGYLRQETSPSRSDSEVTLGINNSPPRYNLRPRQLTTPGMTFVRLSI